MADMQYDQILLNFSSRVDAKGLKSAVDALSKLKDINGFSGLQQAGQDIKGFCDALDGISQKRMSAITELAKAMKGLGGASKAMKAMASAQPANPLNDTSMGTAPIPNTSESALEEIREKAEEANEEVTELKKNIQNSDKPLSKLLARLKRFAEFRMLRAIWSGMINAVKEGFSNLEAWDRRVGKTGFAESMDRARESLLVLKNSLAVVGAPFLEGLISVLQQVASWAMAGANAISRLMAILGGQSSYRAVKWADYTANAVKGTTGAVKDMGKEFKKQLMGFDEINNITEQKGSSGGGGYGNSGYFNYDEMFEERTVGNISEFEKKLKAIVEWFKKIGNELQPIFSKLKLIGDAFSTVWETTKRVASAVATWAGEIAKPAWSAFKNVLNSIVGFTVAFATAVGDAFSAVGDLLIAVGNLLDAFGVWKDIGYKINIILNAFSGVVDQVSKQVMGLALVFEMLSLQAQYVATYFANLKALINHEIDFKTFTANVQKAKQELETNMGNAVDNLKKKMDTVFSKTYTFKVNISENVTRYLTEIQASQADTVHTRTYGFNFKAGGGYVNAGEVFIAREAGPEMVGTIGGHTAVANNDQIVSAVSQGVASAVSAVLGGRNNNVTVTLEGDAKGLFKVVQKEGRAYSARTGQPALA